MAKFKDESARSDKSTHEFVVTVEIASDDDTELTYDNMASDIAETLGENYGAIVTVQDQKGRDR